MRRLSATMLLMVFTAACGGGPTAPPPPATPTTTAVAVVLGGPLRVGKTTQATATATLSNGQSQSITTGFTSDAPSIASVTPAGLVTGMGNGRATISVTSAGIQGQQTIRVVPDYQGQWDGGLRVTSCTSSGVFRDPSDFCQDLAVGNTYKTRLTVTQADDTITAVADYFEGILFPSSSAALDADGAAAFNATFSSASPPLTIDASWKINSSTAGALTGVVEEVWRVPGYAGEGRLVQDLAGFTRTASIAASNSRPVKGVLILQRLRRLRR